MFLYKCYKTTTYHNMLRLVYEHRRDRKALIEIRLLLSKTDLDSTDPSSRGFEGAVGSKKSRGGRHPFRPPTSSFPCIVTTSATLRLKRPQGEV
ncbi:hypothetical protein HZH68_011067 [Vespula germanica]|uniref:Uncharacterized protein n=1 Tax=Vespula germanica TaxID=30212 RepID=A0A834JNG1_VESGE|nr:hypothetical protein HZH68_011067 [Vespula germanica]